MDEAENKSNISDYYRLLFQVEDTGYGISPSELDNFFDAFTQADAGRKSLQGTGLGLAITHKFVQMMGGKIQVTSTVGKGSVFTFDIKLNMTKNNATNVQSGTYNTILNSDCKTNRKLSHTSLLEELMTVPRSWLFNF